MKVLLDENLAHRLRRSLGTHEVFTVSFKGWAGFKNGQLLRIAEENGIEVFLTGDQTLTYEQNLTTVVPSPARSNTPSILQRVLCAACSKSICKTAFNETQLSFAEYATRPASRTQPVGA
jgi:hypothetical protein